MLFEFLAIVQRIVVSQLENTHIFLQSEILNIILTIGVYYYLNCMDFLTRPHNFPGKLFIVEGIDGSGKSTQLMLAMRYLQARGYKPFFTEWNSADLVKATTKRGKKKMSLTPMTFSLLHATDFAHRLVHNILPPLKAGMIVLADRYVYTAFARDVARGCDPDWVRKVYAFAPRPDRAFYFNVPIDVSVARLMAGRAKIKEYEAGMDLKLAPDIMSSFKIFQGRILDEYHKIVGEYGLTEIDATANISEQQQKVRDLVDETLADYPDPALQERA
jgi:dTMP kinase